MDLTILAPMAPAASGVALGGVTLVWLWRRVRQRLRFSMDLRFRIRMGSEDG